MTEQEKIEQAKTMFATLCRTLDQEQWHYEKNEEEFAIECKARGDDLPIELLVRVDVDRRLVMLLSRMPFAVQEDKRVDIAVAVSAINNLLVDGSFDFNMLSGRMYFRMTNSYIDSVLGNDLIGYMLYCSCQTIDEYNDKLLMLAKGMITVEKFIESMKN